MTNAERLVLLQRARHEIERVREELDLVSASCPHCTRVFCLDSGAYKLDEELSVVVGALSSWIEALKKRRPTSERVSSET